MSEITPHYRTIQQLLQSQSFSIDEYQREYKWEKKNIDELLFDLQNKFLASYRQATRRAGQQLRGVFPRLHHRQQAQRTRTICRRPAARHVPDPAPDPPVPHCQSAETAGGADH